MSYYATNNSASASTIVPNPTASVPTPPRNRIPAAKLLEQGDVSQACDPLRYRPNNSLRTFDVFAFIVNKMVGSGIFTAPMSSYLLTGSKGLTIGLWVMAFVHTIFSMLIYLDYCSVFPFTGGELVYVTEMTSFRVNVLGLPRRKADSGNPISTRSETIQGSKPWLRLFLGDGLLAFITYSILFVCLFSTTSNALQFGRLVQLAIWLPDTRNKHPPESGSVSIAGSSLEANLIGFLAFTMLCLIHLWFPRAGRRINKWTAVIKLVAIVTLIIYGSVKNHPLGDQEARDRCTGLATDTRVSITSQGPINLIWARALLAVLFSFQGWENATFVAGEADSPRSIRRGFLWAVFVVGTLYIGVIIVLVFRIDYNSLKTISRAILINYAPIFSGCNNSATVAWAIIAAASSLGSMNSIIYTCSRVKQSIGEANVLPWSRFWSYVHVAMKPQQQRGSNHLAAAAALDGAGIDEKDSRPSISQVSPRGGLALHWLMTTVMMIIIGNLPPTEGSVSLSGILQTYGHTLVLAVVGFLWFRLSSREEALGRTTPNDTSWFRLSKQTGLPWVVLISVGVFGYACFNVAVLVLAPMNYLLPSKKKDPTDSQGLSVHSRGWLLPVVVGSLVLFSFVYFVLVFGAADTWYYDFPERYRGREEDRDQWKVRWKNGFAFPSLQPPAEGLLKGEIFNLIPSTGPWKYLNLPRLAGIKVEIEKEAALSGHSLELERAQSYGNRCRTKFLPLKYKHGASRGYRNEGENEYELLPPQETPHEENSGSSNSRGRKPLFFWYWFFGGIRWLDITPLGRLSDRWADVVWWFGL